jgi:choline dehydrogenase-like flavoprotein
VGKGFSDHPDISLAWRPRHRLARAGQGGLFESVLNFTAAGSDHIGDLEILPMLTPLAEALGLVPGTRAAGRNDYVFTVAVQQAESRGTITTRSADPDVQPVIDYNHLSTASDLDRMRQAVRTAVAILRSRAFEPIFAELTELSDAELADDRALDAWMRAHLGTAIHACGSCPMGPEDDVAAVVDQYGRVHGLTGLRVADTSILPWAPSRGPAATAIMIGERMADFIKSDWAGSPPAG